MLSTLIAAFLFIFKHFLYRLVKIGFYRLSPVEYFIFA